jgi:hypothetical protein
MHLPAGSVPKTFFILTALFLVCVLAVSVSAAGQSVERIGPLSFTSPAGEIKHAIGDKGYRVALGDGWTAEFWFARALPASTNAAPGALYPELGNGEFVGVVSFPKGTSDYRGQAIPPGTYTLRYQYLPQDANHMGVSPNPDFLLAVPLALDDNPGENLPLKRLVGLSSKATGTVHPAVIAMAATGVPANMSKDNQGMVILTVEVAGAAPGKPEKLGIVVKGQATQ